MINKVSNIDTICILIDIENYVDNTKDILENLKIEKEKAKLGSINNANYKHLVSINGMNFQIMTNGSQGYAYIIRNTGYEIKISQFRAGIKALCPIQVRISSEYLWSFGISDSWGIIHNWLSETFGNIILNKVSRVDLCTHISNIDLITNYQRVYKGKFKKTQIFHTGKAINCIKFGSRKNKNIYCRIYNKSLELQETKSKEWFKKIWLDNNMDIKNVWNIEFEIKSELLRRFSISTVNDVITHLKDLWDYCTKNWLIKIDRTNERVERCNINVLWKDIQNSFNEFKSIGLIERNKQIQLDASILVPAIAGSITSYSARKRNMDITDSFNALYADIHQYLSNKNTNFEREVQNKIALLNDCEVIQNE